MRRLGVMRARPASGLRPSTFVLVRGAPVPILPGGRGRRRERRRGRGRRLVGVALARGPREVGVDVYGVALLEGDSDDPLRADGLLLERRAEFAVVLPWRGLLVAV